MGEIVNTFSLRVPGINAVPHEDNLRYFDVTIHGPSQSPYEGTSFPEIQVIFACY
jgi:ubiquitin-protein ligase